MSRIGKMPVEIPEGVKAELAGQTLSVSGKHGKLEREIRPEVEVKVDGGQIILSRKEETKKGRAFHGMERALVNNMVRGVAEGFEKQLQLIGVGYRADSKGKNLELGLGYSHPITFEVPEGIKASVLKEGRDIFVKLEGPDKQQVGQVAAQIRSLRPPEPYKGKGVRYRDEQVRRKAGKAGK